MPTENTLINVFKALEENRVCYSLLRGIDELGEDVPTKEVDLLVKPAHLSAFAQTVGKLGFIELPRWGYEPHYFYVAYDAEADTWLKLDVVTGLYYGRPVRRLKVHLADQCLERRCKAGPAYILSPADEYVTLFLHCLLDKGKFREERRERLLDLQKQAENSPEITETITANFKGYLPGGTTWKTVSELVEENNPANLKKYEKAITRKLFRRSPAGNLSRKIRNRVMRRLRPLYFMLKHRGIWIVLMAPDGGGKTTLAHTLLSEQFLRARLIYMGSNLDSSTIGFPTTRWLKDRIKSLESRKSKKNKIIVKPLKMAAYINRVLEQWYRVAAGTYYRYSGRTVVFDRFIYDSYLAAPPTSKGQRIRRWLINNTCPPADVAYFLDAPGEVLFNRKGEHSPEVLERQRQTFLGLQNKIPNMVIIDATHSADSVRSQVLADIWKNYGKRLNGNGKYEDEN